MKVKNPIYKEPAFTQKDDGNVVTFQMITDADIPPDSVFEVDGKFSDKLALSYEGPWPCGDYMPVKNYKLRDPDPKYARILGTPPYCAFMIRGDLTAIYGDDGKTVLHQYKDIDELLAAGWRVD